MQGLRLLQKHGVEYNILTTVNHINADHPLEVYRFLRDEARTDWIQFIPVVERINEEGNTLYQKGPDLLLVHCSSFHITSICIIEKVCNLGSNHFRNIDSED